MPQQERSNLFVPVVCRCGRNLRAKADQIGSEIRCWDCQQTVLVPMPRDQQQVARELSDGVKGIISGAALNRVMLCAAILTAAFCIPTVGIAVAGLTMALGSLFYGRVIERASGTEIQTTSWRARPSRSTLLSAIVGILMAAGTVVPIWCLNLGEHRSPRWSGLGIAIAATAWVVLPILMFLLHGGDREGKLGWRLAWKTLTRHPVATSMAVLLVPLGLYLLEMGLDLVLFACGSLPFFTIDFMPVPGDPIIYEGVPYYNTVDFRNYPQSRFIASYFAGLRHGYTFVAAIPASLSLPTRAGLGGASLYIGNEWYTALRVFMTWMLQTLILTLFAIQARWLGSIPRLERRRPT